MDTQILETQHQNLTIFLNADFGGNYLFASVDQASLNIEYSKFPEVCEFVIKLSF